MRTCLLVLLAACAGGGTDPVDTGDDSGLAPSGDTSPTDDLAARWATQPMLEAADATEGGCAVLDATRCTDGTVEVCAPVQDDPPLPLHRALVLDRQQDLFHTLDASGVSFDTTVEMPPGTPEHVWSDPATFDRYRHHGDAAYYTGYFLLGAAHRYATTGTAADLDRVRELTVKQLRNWRITGVPGYMFRAPFAMLDENVEVPPGHPEVNLHPYKERSNHVLYELDDAALAELPAPHDGTIDLGEDGTVEATGIAEGSPSLDAYSGALLGLTAAWDLLGPEDQAVKDEIRDTVVCHLHRYKKLRIAKLDDSDVLQDLLGSLLGTGTYRVEDGERDLTGIDTLYGYVLEAKPPDGVVNDDFAWGCPDDLPWEVDEAYDYDATDRDFLGDALDLATRLQGQGDRPIDFVYFTNLRAGDALYLVHLAVQAWHMTGDERYLRFIENELVDEQDLIEVLPTLDHFDLPDFCDSWIGSDLIHPVVMAIFDRLVDHEQPVPRAIRTAMTEAYRYGILDNQGNSWFQITYASYADPTDDPTLEADTQAALADLAGYVPEPDHPFDPKRATNRDWMDSGLDWVDPRTPTEEERAICTASGEIFGVPVEGPGLDDEILNATPVPAGFRTKETQIWHFNPFRLRRSFGGHLTAHEPFNDYVTPYWVARTKGHWADHGTGALGWTATDEVCE